MKSFVCVVFLVACAAAAPEGKRDKRGYLLGSGYDSHALIDHSYAHSFDHSLAHSLDHSLDHSLAHSLDHSLAHSLDHHHPLAYSSYDSIYDHAHFAPAAKIVSINKVVEVPKVVEVRKLVSVPKVVSVPQVVKVSKIVAEPHLSYGHGHASAGWW